MGIFQALTLAGEIEQLGEDASLHESQILNYNQ